MDGKLIGLVRHTVIDQYGPELWESLARPCDSEDMPSDSLAAWVGRETVPSLSDTYPSLFDRHADLASFIGGLGDDLPAVRSPETSAAVSVSLRYSAAPDGSILLRIEAECSLCSLIQGIIAGAAIHYGEQVSIGELKSPRLGDNACVLNIQIGGQDEDVGFPDLERAVI